jgi:hypothetical protein
MELIKVHQRDYVRVFNTLLKKERFHPNSEFYEIECYEPHNREYFLSTDQQTGLCFIGFYGEVVWNVGEKGRGAEAVRFAISQGVTVFRCWLGLVKYYEQFGFVVTGDRLLGDTIMQLKGFKRRPNKIYKDLKKLYTSREFEQYDMEEQITYQVQERYKADKQFRKEVDISLAKGQKENLENSQSQSKVIPGSFERSSFLRVASQ